MRKGSLILSRCWRSSRIKSLWLAIRDSIWSDRLWQRLGWWRSPLLWILASVHVRLLLRLLLLLQLRLRLQLTRPGLHVLHLRIPSIHLRARPDRRRSLRIALRGRTAHCRRPIGRDLWHRTRHRVAPTRWRLGAEDVGEGSISLRRGGRSVAQVVAALLGLRLALILRGHGSLPLASTTAPASALADIRNNRLPPPRRRSRPVLTSPPCCSPSVFPHVYAASMPMLFRCFAPANFSGHAR